MATSKGEEFEFLFGQVHLLAVSNDDVPFAVDGDCLARVDRLPVRALRTAAEQGLDSAEQDARFDRLRDVVVRPSIEPGNLGVVLRPCRQEGDDGVLGVGVVANLHAGLHAIHLGHHHVEQDEVRVPIRGNLDGLDTIGRRFDLKAPLFEVVLDEFEDVRLIVDDEDLLLVHGLGSLENAP